jgi:hypothetical protein
MSDDLSIQGTLAETTVPDLFRSLVRSSETAIVSLDAIGRNDTIYFSEGKIIFAASSDPDMALGEILLRGGELNLQQYDKAMERLTVSRRIGSILVELGFLRPDELMRAVERQVNAIVHSAIFEDATRRAGLNVNNNRYSFAAAWGDYDADGWPDLFVANDFGRKNLYRNNGDGTFRDVSARMGAEDPGAGMSAAWGDYDNDGRLDLYAGNMWSSAGQRLTHNRQFAERNADRDLRGLFQRHARGNTLLANRDGAFEDVTLDAGVEMGRWAWASGFADLDNDGCDDLFVQNGYITGTDTRDL